MSALVGYSPGTIALCGLILDVFLNTFLILFGELFASQRTIITYLGFLCLA